MNEEQYSQIIKKIRKEQGLKQQDIADLLGVTPGQIGHLENGRAYLSLKQLQLLLDEYGYSAILEPGGKVKVFREL